MSKLVFLPAEPTPESLKHKTWMGYGLTKEQARRVVHKLAQQKILLSACGTYQANIETVHTEGWPEITWISFKRVDREPIDDFRTKQAIKNAIVGEEREAVELYPAESRLVDSANQYHLWALPDGMKFPFGYRERLVCDVPLGKSKNRPFQEDAA